MKTILASTGLVILGSTALQAAHTMELTSMETSKPWSLSAALRGFYDDNYTTSPRNVARDSFGFEVNPTAAINLPMDQTFIGASYSYSMRFYEDRPNHRADHSHVANLKLDHAFSERYKLELSEMFVLAQEPQLIDPSGIVTFPLRTEGNNIHNLASANFTAQLTREFGLEVGYSNNLYDYEQTGIASRSAILDRMEHLGLLNFRWTVQPQTVAVVGYNFGVVTYESNDPLFIDPVAGPVFSKVRDNYSHYLYVGADHNFNSQLNGSIRIGGQYTDYHRLGTDEINPYVDLSVTYTYLPGSYVQAGFRHSRSQTDVVGSAGLGNDGVTLDAESSVVYASVNHRVTPKMTASLLGQYQHSQFKGGTSNSQADDFYVLGVNLSYRFSPWLLGEVGYNFDKLHSDVGFRSYDRNRVYVGVRATY